MKSANRTQLVIIVLIAALSLAGSYVLFFYAQSSGEFATTNHGEFVVPPTTVQQLGWDIEGSGSSSTTRWWLWIVASTCDDVCRGTIKNMRALHILLNKEAGRVRRGFTGPGQEALTPWLADYPGLTQVSLVDRESVADGIYIVDPNGNLVLFYPLDTDPKPVLEDLKKLLKMSQIG
jgi:cytochrome oxidase Cu insertion factor (SCO1/SenC/PrrC family)